MKYLGFYQRISKYRVWHVVCTTESVLIDSLVQHDHVQKTAMRENKRHVLLFIFNGNRPGGVNYSNEELISVPLLM